MANLVVSAQRRRDRRVEKRALVEGLVRRPRSREPGHPGVYLGGARVEAQYTTPQPNLIAVPQAD